MISGKLIGGLGNQMWVIAVTTALALRNNDYAAFDLDNCYTPLQGHTSNRYRDNIFKNLKIISNHKFEYLYKETLFNYHTLPYIDDLLLDGYFQSYKYLEGYEKEIQELFHVPPVEMFNCEGLTSVHIRRGDYKNNPSVHPILFEKYYRDAMDLIGGEFLFFSDDMNFVMDTFKGPNIYYSPYDDEIIDLKLMKHCKNNIIANSSFSFWGAYLNPNKDKKVIRPLSWFGLEGPDSLDICPPNWIAI